MVLAKDIPNTFAGMIDVDETFLERAWKNKRKLVRNIGTKRGRGTSQQPVFGLLCWNGQVFAEVVKIVDTVTPLPSITKKAEPGSTVCLDIWKAYTGVAGTGYLQWFVNYCEGHTGMERKLLQMNGRILGIFSR